MHQTSQVAHRNTVPSRRPLFVQPSQTLRSVNFSYRPPSTSLRDCKGRIFPERSAMSRQTQPRGLLALPSEVLVMVLARLPLRDLVKVSQVSKITDADSWLRICGSGSFHCIILSSRLILLAIHAFFLVTMYIICMYMHNLSPVDCIFFL